MKRPFLLPFSPIYGLIVTLRNKAYDLGWMKSVKHELPIVVLGNISAGGTGKTPHTEWLVSNLKDQFKIAVLSRGYGRSTKGFRYVNTDDLAQNAGDEPLQIKKKFPEVTVAVCEDRNTGINQLKKDGYDAILLDDAFQHRKVIPSFSVVLTTFNEPAFKDYFLPGGDLRESISGLRRANAIIVTKCPTTAVNAEEWRTQLKLNNQQSLHFSKFKYGLTKATKSNASQSLPVKIVVVTGIAKPQPLIDHLSKSAEIFHLGYPDHHSFTEADYKSIVEACQKMQTTTVVTTEKDIQRLDTHHPLFKDLSFVVQPIQVDVFIGGDALIEQIKKHIKSFSKEL